MIDILERTADVTIGYHHDGMPIAAKEATNGGSFIYMADGDYVVSSDTKRYWYVEYAVWKTCGPRSGDMFGVWSEYRKRDLADGTAIVYEGDLQNLE